MKNQLSLLIILYFFLLGCHPPISDKLPSSAREQMPLLPKHSQEKPKLRQDLPISAKTMMGSETIELEVALTPQQQAIGLMNRTSLAADKGMLFPFNPPRPVSFWMKNTLIPLDMVFLRDGVVQAIAAEVPPCTSDPCSTYGPGAMMDIDQVIELRSGRAAELGLKKGDRVKIQFL